MCCLPSKLLWKAELSLRNKGGNHWKAPRSLTRAITIPSSPQREPRRVKIHASSRRQRLCSRVTCLFLQLAKHSEAGVITVTTALITASCATSGQLAELRFPPLHAVGQMQSRAVCRQLERLLTEPGSLYHTALSIMLRISGKKKKSKLCKLLTNSFFEITCEECHSYFGPLHFSQCVINSSVTFHLYFMVTRKYLMTSQQVF